MTRGSLPNKTRTPRESCSRDSMARMLPEKRSNILGKSWIRNLVPRADTTQSCKHHSNRCKTTRQGLKYHSSRCQTPGPTQTGLEPLVTPKDLMSRKETSKSWNEDFLRDGGKTSSSGRKTCREGARSSSAGRKSPREGARSSSTGPFDKRATVESSCHQIRDLGSERASGKRNGRQGMTQN